MTHDDERDNGRKLFESKIMDERRKLEKERHNNIQAVIRAQKTRAARNKAKFQAMMDGTDDTVVKFPMRERKPRVPLLEKIYGQDMVIMFLKSI